MGDGRRAAAATALRLQYFNGLAHTHIYSFINARRVQLIIQYNNKSIIARGCICWGSLSPGYE